MWQAEHVRDALCAAHEGLQVEIVPIETRGDKILDVALSKVGGKGLFVKELEVALLDGRVDLCVHSTKDMPAELPEGLGLVAFPPRADPRDALVLGGHGGVMALPRGARVGTSSLRRQAQLLAQRPDLEIVSVRGNIQTRMRKVEELGLACVVLACAGLDRMATEDLIGHRLSIDEMLPAAAQGVLGIEARLQDDQTLQLLAALDHAPTRCVALAERAFLRALGGGCQVPIAAHASLAGDELTVRGLVASPEGRLLVRGIAIGPRTEPERLGRDLAQQVADTGGRRILVALTGSHAASGESVDRAALADAVVIVARDDAPDDSMSLALLRAGAEVVPLRLMALDEPTSGAGLERAVRELSHYDALCFTSVAGVERFFHRLRAAGHDLRGLSANALVAAVGPATAEALGVAGVQVDVVGTGGGEALADALHAALPLTGRRVLLPRAEGGREEFTHRAEALGAEVVVVDAYRSVPREGLREAVQSAVSAIASASHAAVLLTSPRRVELFAQGLEAADRRALAHARIIAVGATTAKALDAVGLGPVTTLSSASPAALVDVLLPPPVEALP